MSDVSVSSDEAFDFTTKKDLPDKVDITIMSTYKGTYWDVSSTKEATWADATAIIKKVFPLDSSDGIIMMNSVPTTDAYGKTQNSLLDTISISRNTYNQINFKDFDSKNIPNIADNYNDSSNIQ